LAYAFRQSTYLLASLGAVLQMIAEWWNLSSYLLPGGANPWSTPSYLTLYAGVAITMLAAWRGLKSHRGSPTNPLSPIRFVNTAGLKLACVGSMIEVIVGVWIEILHVNLLNMTSIAMIEAVLTFGILTVNLGMVIGLTIEYGMIKHGLMIVSTAKRWATVIFILLIFSAIWLGASGLFIYVGWILMALTLDTLMAVLLALMATLVLVSVKRAMPGFGSAIVIGIVFNGVAYFFVVTIARFPLYFPWGVVPLIVFELVLYLLGRTIRFANAAFFSSLVTGMLFCWTYYPFTAYLFPWAFSLQPLLLLVLLGSVGGAFLGNRVYAGLSTAVLGDVTARL